MRQKAAKDAAILAKDISKLEAQIATRTNAPPTPAERAANGFRFVFPDVTGDTPADLDRMIGKNLELSKVN